MLPFSCLKSQLSIWELDGKQTYTNDTVEITYLEYSVATVAKYIPLTVVRKPMAIVLHDMGLSGTLEALSLEARFRNGECEDTWHTIHRHLIPCP